MEGCEIFQAGIGFFQVSVIDRLDISMALIAEIDPEGLLSLAAKIFQGFLFLVVAGGTGQPIGSPLITAEGAEDFAEDAVRNKSFAYSANPLRPLR